MAAALIESDFRTGMERKRSDTTNLQYEYHYFAGEVTETQKKGRRTTKRSKEGSESRGSGAENES